MTGTLLRPHSLGRRDLLRSIAAAAALGAAGSAPSRAWAAGTPWADAPASKVDKLNFVVWTYGDIYTKISKKFTDDWGISVDSTISSFNDHPTKLMTMFAGSETIDVSQSSPFSFPNFISQGLAEPLDALPGAADYLKDFTDSVKQVAVYDGKLMGLPYFSTVWVWNYYSDLMEKAKFEPFKTYEELLEQCRKAKKDGICDYPIMWVAGVGLEQLPGTWYQMTWNRGGVFFDKAGNHQLGPGSIARETLKWWAQTFAEQLVDPDSLKYQFTASAKAFGAGKNLYRGPNHHYGLNIANDPAQSPIAGKVKVLGSGFQSVMASSAVSEGWKPWGDPPKILEIWNKATYVGEICNSIYKPWHFPWTDRLNIEVQKALTGQISADVCCDNLIAAIKEVQKT